MGLLGRAFKVGTLGLAVIASAALGLVFPIPPAIVLSARRRIERTELIRPASGLVTLDPSEPVVSSLLLDRDPEPLG